MVGFELINMKKKLNEHAFFSAILMGLLGLCFFIFAKHYLPYQLEKNLSKSPPRPQWAKSSRSHPSPPPPSWRTDRREYREEALNRPLQTRIKDDSYFSNLEGTSFTSTDDLLSVSPAIHSAVNFWKNIYAYYSVDHVVIHDSENLNIIYAALDFSPLNHANYGDFQKQKLREERVKQEIDVTKNIIEILMTSSPPVTPKEQYIANLLNTHSPQEDWGVLRDQIRSQTGLRERFQMAIRKSGMYLQQMRDIFSSYELPTDLTYIVFVESMFVNRSLSKVGAAGLWQIMPTTGQLYLTINQWIDERLDPILATHAAAKILRSNYETLQSWPLAVNAYNTGTGRIAAASRALGTRDIGVIISRYKDGSYQFASRNFYPSFLAVREIALNYENYLGSLVEELPFEYDIVELPLPTSIHEIADGLGIDLATLHALNPALKKTFFEDEIALPRGSFLRIPAGMTPYFVAASYNKVRRQDEDLWHIVQEGDSLEVIARQYGIPAKNIIEKNNLLRNKLFPGEAIKIPSPQNLASSQPRNE